MLAASKPKGDDHVPVLAEERWHFRTLERWERGLRANLETEWAKASRSARKTTPQRTPVMKPNWKWRRPPPLQLYDQLPRHAAEPERLGRSLTRRHGAARDFSDRTLIPVVLSWSTARDVGVKNVCGGRCQDPDAAVAE